MSAPILVRAARRFLQEDARRKQRPKLTQQEKLELSLDLNTLEGGVPMNTVQARARRGDVAANLLGYVDTFDEVAINVIADILHAVSARGYDPLHVIAHARSEYFRDVHTEEGPDGI